MQINPVTVVGMVRESKVQKGGWLIQAAASSVLGRQVIALCKHQGIKTINIVRRDSAKQEILDAGYASAALNPHVHFAKKLPGPLDTLQDVQSDTDGTDHPQVLCTCCECLCLLVLCWLFFLLNLMLSCQQVQSPSRGMSQLPPLMIVTVTIHDLHKRIMCELVMTPGSGLGLLHHARLFADNAQFELQCAPHLFVVQADIK